METKKRALGRGLEELFNSDNIDINSIEKNIYETATSEEIVDIPLAELRPNPYQPRTIFTDEALKELSVSIKEHGVFQPIIVKKSIKGYEIIAGERRWRASKIANIKEVPVIEKDLSNQEVLEVALIENLLREDLSIIEEAEGYSRLITEFSHTHEALSQIIGKSRSYITNTLRLLTLPITVQEYVKNGSLSAGHAKVLVGLENVDEIAQKIISKGLTVRQTEEYVSNLKNNAINKISKAIKKDPSIKELEKNISKNIGLKVRINAKENDKGKITIEYKNPAELNSILEILENSK